MKQPDNILIVVDAAHLLGSINVEKRSAPVTAQQQQQQRDLPEHAGTPVYLITANSFANVAEPGSVLTLHTHPGSVLHWAITCTGAGLDYSAILLDVVARPNIAPVFRTEPLDITLFTGSPTVKISPVHYTDFCFSGIIKRSGTFPITIIFELFDKQKKSMGIYSCYSGLKAIF